MGLSSGEEGDYGDEGGSDDEGGNQEENKAEEKVDIDDIWSCSSYAAHRDCKMKETR